MFKIGIGPSSSHTLGPWRAALRFLDGLRANGLLQKVQSVQVLLYGSLAKTGKGHGTDVAVMLGLCGEDPVTFDVNAITPRMESLASGKHMLLAGELDIPFDPATDVVFLMNDSLPAHPNALTFLCTLNNGQQIAETYYSIGGGFVIKEGEGDSAEAGDRDKLFREAAEVVIQHQQGSTSLLQRRLKVGYGRAARIIDQLHAAGVLGPPDGSKPRDVLLGLEDLDRICGPRA